MAKSYHDVVAKIAELQREAESLRQKEVAGIVSRIKEAISTYGLSASDLGFGPGGVRKRAARKAAPAARKAAPVAAKTRGKTSAGRKVAIKYRDGSGNTWTGRGSKPRWLTAALKGGAKIEDFAV